MIEVGSVVKFNGSVSAIDTGTFSVNIKEFFIIVEIATTDYDNHLTTSELTFISSALERLMRNTNFEDCEKEVADSIIKKLKS